MLIGITGKKFSGKSTVARMLADATGYEVMSFADRLKDVTVALTGCRREDLDSFDFKENEFVPEYLHVFCGGNVPTYRAFLQYFGTDVMRSYNDNIWIDSTLGKGCDNVIVSDVRFKNEADAIRSRGGIIVKVERAGYESFDEHISEVELEDIQADVVVMNNGSLGDLDILVRKIYESWR